MNIKNMISHWAGLVNESTLDEAGLDLDAIMRMSAQKKAADREA